MAKLIDLVSTAAASKEIFEAVSNVVPEIGFFDSRKIAGTSFQTNVRITKPTAGFRAVGTGVVPSVSGYELKTFNMKVLSGVVTVDKAAAEGDIRGRDKMLADEAIGQIASASRALAQQIWEGSDPAGFTGARQLVKASNVVDVEGTTANTGSAVFAVGNNVEDACGLNFSQDSKLLNVEELEWFEQLIAQEGGKVLPSFWTDLSSFCGFSCMDPNKIAMAKNITADEGKGCTDDVLAEVLEKYMEANSGVKPDAFWMSWRSARQLRRSRGLSLETLDGSFITKTAGVPTDFGGIPIYITSAISDTAAIA
jgi:hypothetical protein